MASPRGDCGSAVAGACVRAGDARRLRRGLKALGKTGDFKGNVLKVNIPRTDLSVAVQGVNVPTPFGFGGWIAMTKGDGAMDVMMGDLVLTESEVNPVMRRSSTRDSVSPRFTTISFSRAPAFTTCTCTVWARPRTCRRSFGRRSI